MSQPSPRDRFDRIVRDGLCIGCGLCASLLGDKVQIARAGDGELRPRVCDALTDADVDLVYDTCPGTRCEALAAGEAAVAPYHDLVWGPYQSLSLAWASEPEVRFEGSTGGVLTALGRYLLEAGEVAFVLHVKASEQQPTHGEARLSFTAAEVLSGAGSRYGPTAPLVGLSAALDREEPFAVIAKPCDLNAIRNLARRDARVDRWIRFQLAPVCGGYMPDRSMGCFLADQGVEREQVTALRYRGRGCPGATTVTTADGVVREFHYLDFWGEDESAWSLPSRCKICPDGIGEAADIVAADTWPRATPDRERSLTDPGTNAVMARTARGETLLRAATAAGFLTAGRTVGVDYLNETQPHQVTKKRFMRARFDGMARAGRLVPQAVGLRLDALYAENDPAENRRQEEGAFQRAQRRVEWPEATSQALSPDE